MQRHYSLAPIMAGLFLYACSSNPPVTKRVSLESADTYPEGSHMSCSIDAEVTLQNVGEKEQEMKRTKTPRILSYKCKVVDPGTGTFMELESAQETTVDRNLNGVVDIYHLTLTCPSPEGPKRMEIYFRPPASGENKPLEDITVRNAGACQALPDLLKLPNLLELQASLECRVATGAEKGVEVLPQESR